MDTQLKGETIKRHFENQHTQTVNTSDESNEYPTQQTNRYINFCNPNASSNYLTSPQELKLARIIDREKIAYNTNTVTAMVLLDLGIAYCTIWRDGLVYNLYSINFPLL